MNKTASNTHKIIRIEFQSELYYKSVIFNERFLVTIALKRYQVANNPKRSEKHKVRLRAAGNTPRAINTNN